IQILNSLAIIFSEVEQWENAKSKFEKAIEVFKKSISIDDITIYIRLCYNLSKLLYNMNSYIDSLTYCNKGLRQGKKYKTSYLLGELLYQKGITLIKMENKIEGIKYLRFAYTIFDIFKKDNYLKIAYQKI